MESEVEPLLGEGRLLRAREESLGSNDEVATGIEDDICLTIAAAYPLQSGLCNGLVEHGSAV
jgi:hypothetical protein